MPIYEYECEGCHEVFAVRQKVSDPRPESHTCGSKEVRRILSATSFVLKGTGWYKTDYADKARPEGDGARAGEAGQKEAPSGADAKAQGTGDTPAQAAGASSGEAKATTKAEGPPPTQRASAAPAAAGSAKATNAKAPA